MTQLFLLVKVAFSMMDHKRPAGSTEKIPARQSKRLSNKNVRPPITATYSLSPKLKWHN